MSSTSSPVAEQAGPIYWIDHFVVCTTDAPRWADFHTRALGARIIGLDEGGVPLSLGYFLELGPYRIGGFISRKPLPPTRGVGVGLPRYGFYVDKADINVHLRRLDEIGAPHSAPQRIENQGEPGTAIYFQDPDGNQFEFWAPDTLPEGAMHDASPAGVGRISHGTFESRDLARSAALFARYCGLTPVANAAVASDILALRLAGGGRLVFRQVTELEGRTTGCGIPDAHTALLLRSEDFFPNYQRMWAELPEWDFDAQANAGKPIENPGGLPARTVLHVSPAGRKFKALTGRGDDWLDWDTNMFHFYGGDPIGGSMARYEPHSVDEYMEEWARTHGGMAELRSVTAPPR